MFRLDQLRHGQFRRLGCGMARWVEVGSGTAVVVRRGRAAFVGLGLGVAWLGGQGKERLGVACSGALGHGGQVNF